ncbi:phage portal protein [Paraclostridium sordellii]|uniref:phage portal protein n=1 Tax=Paraclostridium sordellii TaxID=1505 RepID=UPI0005E54DA1|nr:phage portal protein [Paeniclostridium sordellii]CEQ26766.1 phage portal protein [[Clostridium] sordellii] [Paeniclostridium sordellii]
MGLIRDLISSKKEKVEVDITSSGFKGYSKTDEDIAMKISALNNGLSLISETLASLPLYKYRRLEDGSKVRVSDDKLHYLLNVACNQSTSAFNMKDTFIRQAILEGNGYLYIQRKGNSISSLHLVEDVEQDPYVTKDGLACKYKFKLGDREKTCNHHDMINLARYTKDGIKGKGILEHGKDVLGIANSLNQYQGATLENGAFIKGMMQVPNEMPQDERQSLTSKIRDFFSGKSSGSVLVLSKDIDFKPISLSPSDIEALKSSEFSVDEIARLLKVPPDMLKGTSNRSEQSDLYFLKYCLLAYIRQVEEVFNHYLLLESEKNGEYFFEFNIDNLLRTDKATEMKYYRDGVEGGIFTINEARNKLNKKSIKGADILLLSKFNMIIDENGEKWNTQSVTKLKDIKEEVIEEDE